ncbi:MAG: ankyrin repeat domain-containing protein [Pseudomonadales bacterium]|nr:ankyrin repeat domain-containing protein [Pseudomonadales bacterium]
MCNARGLKASKLIISITLMYVFLPGLTAHAGFFNGGQSKLYAATVKGDLTKTDKFIRKTKNINETDYNAWSALHWAARDGHFEVVKKLVVAGADVNFKVTASNGMTPYYKPELENASVLYFAALNNRMEIVKYLIQNGAKLTGVDIDNLAVLPSVAANGNIELATLLVSGGVNVDGTDRYQSTGLMLAALTGKLDMVKYLIAQGANINAVNSVGNTALILAARNGQDAIIELLIDKHANIQTSTFELQDSAITAAARSGHSTSTILLLEGGADINAMDSDGRTSLFIAASKGHTELALQLVERGALPLAVTGSEDDVYASANLVHMIAEHYARSDRQQEAGELYETAAKYYQTAAKQYDQAKIKAKKKAIKGKIKTALAGALVMSLAYTQARISAKQMASISPSGKGVGVSMVPGFGGETTAADQVKFYEYLSELSAQAAIESIRASNCIVTSNSRQNINTCIGEPQIDTLKEFLLSTRQAWAKGEMNFLGTEHQREGNKSRDYFVNSFLTDMRSMYGVITQNHKLDKSAFMVALKNDEWLLTNHDLYILDGQAQKHLKVISLNNINTYKYKDKSGARTYTFTLKTGKPIKTRRLESFPKDKVLDTFIGRTSAPKSPKPTSSTNRHNANTNEQ